LLFAQEHTKCGEEKPSQEVLGDCHGYDRAREQQIRQTQAILSIEPTQGSWVRLIPRSALCERSWVHGEKQGVPIGDTEKGKTDYLSPFGGKKFYSCESIMEDAR
jgi:hypothetical protein